MYIYIFFNIILQPAAPQPTKNSQTFGARLTKNIYKKSICQKAQNYIWRKNPSHWGRTSALATSLQSPPKETVTLPQCHRTLISAFVIQLPLTDSIPKSYYLSLYLSQRHTHKHLSTMPYSAIFQGYIRTTTTPLLSMSLRPTATTYFRAPKSLRPSLLPFFTRNRPPRFGNSHVRPYSRPRVTCSAVEVDRRVRQRRVAMPFWNQQSSGYGRFAYQDVSSDESDSELGPAQQQSVSFRLPHFV
jgi:hypothetical protein